jgi:hypothetical protein
MYFIEDGYIFAKRERLQFIVRGCVYKTVTQQLTAELWLNHK